MANVRFLVIVLVVMVLSCFCTQVMGKYGGGSGILGDPYLISEPNHLQAIGADSNDWDKHFLLVNDINLAEYTGMSFHRIGEDWDKPFTGVFDGNCHTVKNFNWSSNTEMYIGIFGYTALD